MTDESTGCADDDLPGSVKHFREILAGWPAVSVTKEELREQFPYPEIPPLDPGEYASAVLYGKSLVATVMESIEKMRTNVGPIGLDSSIKQVWRDEGDEIARCIEIHEPEFFGMDLASERDVTVYSHRRDGSPFDSFRVKPAYLPPPVATPHAKRRAWNTSRGEHAAIKIERRRAANRAARKARRRSR